MTATPVSISDVLLARDRRARLQKQFIERYSLPLVSFTMNIPGEIKRSPSGDLAFNRGLEMLKEELGEPVDYQIIDENTGIEAILVYGCSAQRLKEICENIENSEPVGRLYDMDVIKPDGTKLSRSEPRKCIVCGGPVSVCSRSRNHGLDSITSKVAEVLSDFTSRRLSELAVNALIKEARLSPKPGLVDAFNNGSHKDMNLDLFIKSANSLKDYFRTVAEIASEEDNCMPRLVAAGIEAEKSMLSATCGVNTHKGAIYNMGLVTAALSACAKRGGNPFERAACLAGSGYNIQQGSHGEIVREKFGALGARHEACSGFPTAAVGLAALNNGDTAIDAFMKILLVCNDTNLLYRGGEEGLTYARLRAKEFLSAPDGAKDKLIKEIDRDFISKNLSPGGSADMLAVAFLLYDAKCLYE